MRILSGFHIDAGGTRRSLKVKRLSSRLIAAITALGVGACQQATSDPTLIPTGTQFLGAAAADDARAASVGGTILRNGGSAADAVVAMYFTTAVTWPSRAGLGGGGVCVAHSGRETEKGKRPVAYAIDFLPRGAQGATVGLPGNIRGMAALHAVFGRLKWGQVVGPAEGLAHLGTPVSVAFGQDLMTNQARIKADPGLASIYLQKNGAPLTANMTMVQPDLAHLLSQVRERGGINFYNSEISQTISAAAQRAGFNLPPAQLANFRPIASEPLSISFGPSDLLTPLPPASGSVMAAETAYILENVRNIDSADNDEIPGVLTEVARQVWRERPQWQRPDGGSALSGEALADEDRLDGIMESQAQGRPLAVAETPSIGFAAIDGEGGAAACVVTLNQIFGAGKILPGLGIVAAAVPTADQALFSDLAASVIVSRYTGAAFSAATGSGSTAAGTTLGQVLARNWVMDIGVIDAQNAPRFAIDAGGNTLADQSAPGPILGRVNAIQCPNGVPSGNSRCYPVADPRGYGTAVISEEQP